MVLDPSPPTLPCTSHKRCKPHINIHKSPTLTFTRAPHQNSQEPHINIHKSPTSTFKRAQHCAGKEPCTNFQVFTCVQVFTTDFCFSLSTGSKTCIFRNRALHIERWGAGVETPKNVRGEIGGWGRNPFNEPYAPSLSTIYDGA